MFFGERRGNVEYVHGGDIYTYGDVLDFSSNINPFGAPRCAIDAAKDAVEEIEHYPDNQCRELAAALGEHLGAEPASIAFGNGAADLIFGLAFAERPRKALLVAPSFAEYAQALEAAGCEIVYYRLDADNRFDLDEGYIGALAEDIDITFLCTPNNPTGRAMDRGLLERAMERCGKLGIRMVLDECFCDFLVDHGDRTMLGYVEDGSHPQLVVLRAFTKMYGMPGLRLGYMLCSDGDLMERMQRTRQPWSVSNVAQAAGLAALSAEDPASSDDGIGWSERTRRYVLEERIWMEKQLDRLGVEYLPADANFILLRSGIDLFEKMLGHGILIRDCSNYIGLDKGYYRIAVKTREQNQQLVKTLEDVLEEAGK